MDQTLQPDQDDDLWRLPGQDSQKSVLQPRMTVLFHPDPSFIGASTPPHVLEKGNWVDVGRTGPGFVAPLPSIQGGPLSDPYTSRQQFKIRWDAHFGRFEVAPLSSNKRALVLIDLTAQSAQGGLQSLTGLTRLEPGAIVALGNRILLRLELAQWRPPHEDRMEMVGESDGVWALRDALAQIAKLDKPAFVLGPTGAGKELVAKALHAQRNRGKSPFIPVNCAAVPEHLAESLFFGHKKGAFTGADADRDGYFLQAGGGTLFLDELGELPMVTQAKLLRVLQERKLTPVGARSTVPVSACLVAATNRDPEEEMSKGRLRPDFYFRIAAHTLNVPPLAERRFDVPMLFVHFLSRSRQDHPELERLWDVRAKRPWIPMAFVLSLLRQPWRGNIRELQNLVDQTVRENLHDGPFVVPEALLGPGAPVRSAPAHTPVATPGPQNFDPQCAIEREAQLQLATALGVARKTLERLLILGKVAAQAPSENTEAFVERVRTDVARTLSDIFEQNGANQVRAAQALSMSRTTFIRLMKQFGIPRT